VAFNNTSLNAQYIESTGIQPRLMFGITALSAGTKVVTIPGIRTVVTAWAESQTANAARVSDTTGATLTLTGTGTDNVAWFAIVK
jgi:hypothetical protein